MEQMQKGVEDFTFPDTFTVGKPTAMAWFLAAAGMAVSMAVLGHYMAIKSGPKIFYFMSGFGLLFGDRGRSVRLLV